MDNKEVVCWRCESHGVWHRGHSKGKDQYTCNSCGRWFTLPVKIYRYSPVPRCRYCGVLLDETNWFPSKRKDRRFVCSGCYRPRVNNHMRHYFRRTRQRLLALLGESCACKGSDCWHSGPCNVSDSRVLQIDHVYGGGVNEVRRVFGHARDMYLFYLKNPDEAKGRLQPLCANCNWAKLYRNRERPDKYGLSGAPE